jgi:hypothetical protein
MPVFSTPPQLRLSACQRNFQRLKAPFQLSFRRRVSFDRRRSFPHLTAQLEGVHFSRARLHLYQRSLASVASPSSTAKALPFGIIVNTPCIGADAENDHVPSVGADAENDHVPGSRLEPESLIHLLITKAFCFLGGSLRGSIRGNKVAARHSYFCSGQQLSTWKYRCGKVLPRSISSDARNIWPSVTARLRHFAFAVDLVCLRYFRDHLYTYASAMHRSFAWLCAHLEESFVLRLRFSRRQVP